MNPRRTLPLLAVALSAFSAPALAQNCVSALVADVPVVSVSAGGVQNISVQVSGPMVNLFTDSFQMVGSFGGTSPGHPHLAYGGLFLNVDRYTLRCLNGESRLIHPVGGSSAFPNYVPLDAQGQAQVRIVVPAGLYSAYLGKTVHHGIYALDISLLPACGSNTVALTFAP